MIISEAVCVWKLSEVVTCLEQSYFSDLNYLALVNIHNNKSCLCHAQSSQVTKNTCDKETLYFKPGKSQWLWIFLFFSNSETDDVSFLYAVVAFVILVPVSESKRWSCVLGLFSITFRKEISILMSEKHLFIWRRSEQTQRDVAK